MLNLALKNILAEYRPDENKVYLYDNDDVMAVLDIDTDVIYSNGFTDAEEEYYYELMLEERNNYESFKNNE